MGVLETLTLSYLGSRVRNWVIISSSQMAIIKKSTIHARDGGENGVRCTFFTSHINGVHFKIHFCDPNSLEK